jgi:hypothetical protein
MLTIPMTKISAGVYEYRGYRISYHLDENDDWTGEWDIAEKVDHINGPGGMDWSEWAVFETCGSLHWCIKLIDGWACND